MEHELADLERNLDALIAHAQALHAANVELRRELADARESERALRERMKAASERLDAVLARIPAE